MRSRSCDTETYLAGGAVSRQRHSRERPAHHSAAQLTWHTAGASGPIARISLSFPELQLPQLVTAYYYADLFDDRCSLQGHLGDQCGTALADTSDLQPATYCFYPVLQANQSRPVAEVRAADAVVLHRQPHTAGVCRHAERHGRCVCMLGRVGQSFGRDLIRRDLDALR